MDYVTKALLEESLKAINKSLEEWVKKANAEVASATSMSTETKGALETLSVKASEIVDRLVALELKSKQMPADTEKALTLGEQFLKMDGFERWQKTGAGALKMDVPGFALSNKTAIVNATGQNQPLVPPMRLPGVMHEPNRPLTVRDLLPVGQTTSNLIEYTKENVFTNNAGPQYSSPNRENVTKPESALTFTLATTAVITLAHWIPVSKQVLADAPQLMSYINTRLMYGLKLEEEDQLLNGDGASGNLSGLLKAGNFTAYNRTTTGDTKIDVLRRLATQVSLSNYPCDAYVLHPADWEDIELLKDSQLRYIWTNPSLQGQPQLWGRRVIPTQAIAEGTFLGGCFSMGAQVWDREQASVTVSYENSDNFVKNMATILAEERLALAVYRPKAFVSGSF